MVGMLGFGLASAWGGLAQSGLELIIARGLQGVLAALLAPAALALLTVTFPSPRLRIHAVGERLVVRPHDRVPRTGRRTAQPVRLDPDPRSQPAAATSFIGMSLYMAFHLQIVLGLSQLWAGLASLGTTIATIITAPLVATLLPRWGARVLMSARPQPDGGVHRRILGRVPGHGCDPGDRLDRGRDPSPREHGRRTKWDSTSRRRSERAQPRLTGDTH